MTHARPEGLIPPAVSAADDAADSRQANAAWMSGESDGGNATHDAAGDEREEEPPRVDWGQRLKEWAAQVGDWVEALLPAPEPVLIPVPVPVRRRRR